MLLSTFLKDFKSTYHRDSCIFILLAVIFTMAKTWDKLRCASPNEQYISIIGYALCNYRES